MCPWAAETKRNTKNSRSRCFPFRSFINEITMDCDIAYSGVKLQHNSVAMQSHFGRHYKNPKHFFHSLYSLPILCARVTQTFIVYAPGSPSFLSRIERTKLPFRANESTFRAQLESHISAPFGYERRRCWETLCNCLRCGLFIMTTVLCSTTPCALEQMMTLYLYTTTTTTTWF